MQSVLRGRGLRLADFMNDFTVLGSARAEDHGRRKVLSAFALHRCCHQAFRHDYAVSGLCQLEKHIGVVHDTGK